MRSRSRPASRSGVEGLRATMSQAAGKARPSAAARWSRGLWRPLRTGRARSFRAWSEDRHRRFGTCRYQRDGCGGRQRRQSDRFRPDATRVDAFDMRRPMTLRTRRGPAYLDEGDFPGVEPDGKMGAARKRARHQLEYEHDAAGGGQQAASPIPQCADRHHACRIALAIRDEQMQPAPLAFC